MNKYILLLLFFRIHAQDAVMTAQSYDSLRMYGGLLSMQENIMQCMTIVKKDIERSGQFNVELMHTKAPTHKKEITELFHQGYPLVLFIDEYKKDAITGIEWRLYDATQAHMVKGKKQELTGTIHQQAHALSNGIWHELMGGQKNSFSTRIAYIKRDKNKLGKRISHLCTCDWLGEDTHVVCSSARILVAPSWYKNQHEEEQMFFSEFTPKNVRCMKLDKQGNKIPMFDLDGTCVGISVQGNNAVYCRSGSLWKYTYDEKLKRGIHERLIHQEQPCTHPTVLDTHDIIYCSGGTIFQWEHANKKSRALTQDGYCVAPDVHEQSIVYSRRINGIMQLMILDQSTGTIEQLTHDAGDKVDPRWSPCGQYIVFCVEKGHTSRIAIIHRTTGAFYYLTAATDHCSYPAWSCFNSWW